MDAFSNFALPTTQYFVWIGVKAYTGIWNALLVKPLAPMIILSFSLLFIAGKNLRNPKDMVIKMLIHIFVGILILICVFPQKEINITDIRDESQTTKSTILEEMGLNNSSGKFPYFLWYYWTIMQSATHLILDSIDIKKEGVGEIKYKYNNEDINQWESAYQNIGREFLSFYKNDYLPALSDYFLLNSSLSEKEQLDMALYPDDRVINWMTEAARPLKIRQGGYKWIVNRKSLEGMSLSDKMIEYGKYLQEKYIKLYPNATAREHLIKQIHKQFIENNELSQIDSRKSVSFFNNSNSTGLDAYWDAIKMSAGNLAQSLTMFTQRIVNYLAYDFLPITRNGAFLIFFLGMGLIIPMSFMPGWWSIYFKWMMSIYFLWTWDIAWKVTDLMSEGGILYFRQVVGVNDLFMESGGLDFTIGLIRILIVGYLAAVIFAGPMGLTSQMSTVITAGAFSLNNATQFMRTGVSAAKAGGNVVSKGVSATAKAAQKVADMVRK